MAKKTENILHDLFVLASDAPLVARARICAAIVKRNKIISYGFNKEKTHTLQAKYAKHPKAIHTHAEIDAIINALKKVNISELAGSDIYIARAKKVSNTETMIPGLVTPCEGCQRAIEAFKIRNVYHT